MNSFVVCHCILCFTALSLCCVSLHIAIGLAQPAEKNGVKRFQRAQCFIDPLFCFKTTLGTVRPILQWGFKKIHVPLTCCVHGQCVWHVRGMWLHDAGLQLAVTILAHMHLRTTALPSSESLLAAMLSSHKKICRSYKLPQRFKALTCANEVCV